MKDKERAKSSLEKERDDKKEKIEKPMKAPPKGKTQFVCAGKAESNLI